MLAVVVVGFRSYCLSLSHRSEFAAVNTSQFSSLVVVVVSGFIVSLGDLTQRT